MNHFYLLICSLLNLIWNSNVFANLISKGDAKTPICGAHKIACYNEAEDELLKKFFTDGLDKNRIPDKKECNCLPSCTAIAYDAEISQANLDAKSFFLSIGGEAAENEFP